MMRLNCQSSDFEARFTALISRDDADTLSVMETVRDIIARVRRDGDAAVLDLTNKFDRVQLGLGRMRITPEEIAEAAAGIPAALRDSLALAARRIEAFHRAQLPSDMKFTDDAGATMGLRWGPVDSVGIYVPGGKASYPSSVLMNAIPARAAGVGRVAMCVPAPDNILNPLVLAAAQLAGVTEVYRIGGAQAIAALAYGTALIQPVDRIVGPGNAYVAEAKRQVFGQVGIESMAGPSEVLIIADAKNNPMHIALDLLAQAEHGEDSQCMLITDDPDFADSVAAAVDAALPALPRSKIAGAAWRDLGAIIVARNWAEAASLANRIAPEHLQLMVAAPTALFANIRHAGATFFGADCPTALGDYIAGPNHVLPTSGTARFASGLSVYDFLKRATWVSLAAGTVEKIGPAAIALAHSESLAGHAQSVAARLGGKAGG